MSDGEPMHPDLRATHETLDRLFDVLCAEHEALRRFDVPAIEHATAAKLELEPELADLLRRIPGAPITEDERTDLLGLRAKVADLAHANLRRLRASLETIDALIARLTGSENVTYGRGWAANGPTQAVLASEQG